MDVDLDGGRSRRGDVEVLVIGPETMWSAAQRRTAGVVALVVLLLVGAGWLGWRVVAIDNPTFSSPEVLGVYQVPAPRPGDSLTWDPDTLFTEDQEPRSDDAYVTEPTGCGTVVANDTPSSTSVDSIGVELHPVDGHYDTENYIPTVTTYLYADPAAARHQLDHVRQSLGRCRAFRAEELRFSVSDVHAAGSRRAGSILGFVLTLDSGPHSIRIELLQFGNTVTWTIGARAGTDPMSGSGAVNQEIATRLRAVYRAR